MSSWSVLAVRAARLWSVWVFVCDWWVWERVRKYSVTQESNVAACGFLTGSIVVEGDMFSWGKARPVLSPPPTPLTLHSPSIPHTRTLGTLLITLIALTVQWRRTELDRAFPCSVLCFNQLYTLCVLPVCIMCSDWYLSEVEYELQGWFSVRGLESQFHSYASSSVVFLIFS